MNRDIEKKWQKKWSEDEIFQANPDDREKMFLTVAYPYPSGSMHVGHGRTYTVPDVYARFKRMQGYNVLFPMAWHVTGAPVIGIAKRIENQHEKTLDLYRNLYKVPEDTLESFKEPENIVKFFSNQYHNDMDDMGFSIDWRREFRTTDPTYKKFIEWQIRKLRDKGYVRKGSHPVKYCPDCKNPVGDHDLLEGEGVGVNELTLLKFEIDGKYLVPATFRPETIFGITNIWMNPDAEYIQIELKDGEEWIISTESYMNLTNQKKDIKIIKILNTDDFIGKTAKSPYDDREIPILPASFVDPEYGTGVVFSVPGHAPADYIALKDIKANDELLEKYDLKDVVSKIEAKNVINLEGYSDIPARDLVEGMKIENQEDPKLQDATNQLYKAEHSKGIMSEHISKYAGQKVRFARDEIAGELKEKSKADVLYDFAERPVICRCGEKCVVRIMDNQWFLKYSDEDWKEITRKCLANETIIPKEVRANFEYYIGWLEDWACSRRIGLGTKLPWDKKWLIEPLSDSTIYMSYYTIAKYLRNMKAGDLNDAFFDKVFLNKESDDEIKVKADLVSEIQREHNYWYPLNWRLSAKDLIGNHLTFHMFHHTAIFPEDKWPQGIVVFGMGLLEGKKMSSSKGNVILLSDAIEKYGSDVVRLFLMSSAEPWQDFDWREKEVKGTQRRLEWFVDFVKEWNSYFDGFDLNEECVVKNPINKWILNQLNIRIANATEALEGFQTRKAVQESLFLFKKDVDHYIHRIENFLDDEDETAEIRFTMEKIIGNWIKLLSPFTPHISEELWEICGGEGFSSEAIWPKVNSEFVDETVEKSEEIVNQLIHDINEIKKIIGEDISKVHLYLSPDWKWDVYEIANEVGKPNVGQIMGKSIAKNLNDDKKELADFAKKIAKEMTKTKYIGKIDEKEVIDNSLSYIESEVESVVVVHSDDSYDPENKARNAMPYKPAIFIE